MPYEDKIEHDVVKCKPRIHVGKVISWCLDKM